MFLGTTLHHNQSAYTDWMDAPALHAYITIQLLAISSTYINLQFQVYTRDSDEGGAGTAIGSAVTIDGSLPGLPRFGTADLSSTGFKNQWRVKVTTTDDGSSLTSADWVRFQMLSPSFFDAAN